MDIVDFAHFFGDTNSEELIKAKNYRQALKYVEKKLKKSQKTPHLQVGVAVSDSANRCISDALYVCRHYEQTFSAMQVMFKKHMLRGTFCVNLQMRCRIRRFASSFSRLAWL